MKYLQVRSIAICPFTWNSLPLEAIVENGSVALNDQLFDFNDGEGYPDGTMVLVQKGRNIYCESLAEIAEIEANRERKREAYLQLKQIEENERLAQISSFHNSLNVPVNWSPEIKPVLSGLSEHSNGDGCRKNTKVHVYLRESLEGRLRRSANSFLCRSSRGNHFNELIRKEGPHLVAVDCPQCLKIVERWSK
jgi:hypothetical protein